MLKKDDYDDDYDNDNDDVDLTITPLATMLLNVQVHPDVVFMRSIL
jgi:hypothetical protein